MSTFNEVVTAFGAERVADRWMAHCPCHRDDTPSLSISEGRESRILLHCFAGCSQDRLIAEAKRRGLSLDGKPGRKGSETERRIVEKYDYEDENGTLIFRVVRTKPKGFYQRRPDPDHEDGWINDLKGVTPLPYRLRELLAEPDMPVYIVEGEKDAETLSDLGLVATSNSGGAGKWQPEISRWFKGRRVRIIPDNDEPGRRHAEGVARALNGTADRIKIITLPDLPEKGDVSDWLDRGGTIKDLERLAHATPVWVPSAEEPEEPDEAEAQLDDEEERKPKQVDILIRLASKSELFHAPDATAYADIFVSGHRETWPIGSKGFRRWLVRQYYEMCHSAPNGEALKSALNTITAQAHYDGPEQSISIRAAEHEGRLYLDLCDPQWRAVEIDATGWRIVTEPPVRFRRRDGMLMLPVPLPGGSIRALNRFTNTKTRAQYMLMSSWLLAALRARGPYPVLVLIGEQGSGKSIVAALLRALVDPNAAPLRSLPREDRDLFIAANNSHVIAIDNVSSLAPWLSDTLCRLATGGGFATRTLYSNDEETLFSAMRPIILTGIDDFVTRGDLSDRSIFLRLGSIPEEKRQPESELLAAFNKAAPGILGALLDAMVSGIAALPTAKLDRLPRMADFALWVTACESGAGWVSGSFMSAYNRNRSDASVTVIEGDSVALAVRELVSTRWDGTVKQLLAELTDQIGETAARSRNWPKTPRALSGRLRRSAPNLRGNGIVITWGRHTDRGSLVKITKMTKPENGCEQPSGPSGPSESSNLNALDLTVGET